MSVIATIKNKEYTDIVISYQTVGSNEESSEYYAHRTVLSSVNYFKNLFLLKPTISIDPVTNEHRFAYHISIPFDKETFKNALDMLYDMALKINHTYDDDDYDYFYNNNQEIVTTKDKSQYKIMFKVFDFLEFDDKHKHKLLKNCIFDFALIPDKIGLLNCIHTSTIPNNKKEFVRSMFYQYDLDTKKFYDELDVKKTVINPFKRKSYFDEQNNTVILSSNDMKHKSLNNSLSYTHNEYVFTLYTTHDSVRDETGCWLSCSLTTDIKKRAYKKAEDKTEEDKEGEKADREAMKKIYETENSDRRALITISFYDIDKCEIVTTQLQHKDHLRLIEFYELDEEITGNKRSRRYRFKKVDKIDKDDEDEDDENEEVDSRIKFVLPNKLESDYMYYNKETNYTRGRYGIITDAKLSLCVYNVKIKFL